MNDLICLTFIFAGALIVNWISTTCNSGVAPYKKFVFMLIAPRLSYYGYHHLMNLAFQGSVKTLLTMNFNNYGELS